MRSYRRSCASEPPTSLSNRLLGKRPTEGMADKKLTNQQLLGEQGIALISLAVSSIGFVWRPTSQHDTGIDGEIELRDTVTGAVSGLLLKVQSKAVSEFANETADGFDYWPEARDVAYWLGHNVPVILVVSRPSTKEVYWQPVQEPSGQARSRKFRFDKRHNALNAAAAGRLTELVREHVPGARGLALQRPERLISNLLPVTKLPARLYLAETPHRTGKDVTDALYGKQLSFEFVLKNERVLTVRDLTDPRYEFLCDRGTVEDFSVEEWSASEDPNIQRDFVRLLNQCLRQALHTATGRIHRDKQTNAYFFPSNSARTAYSLGYQGQKKATAREVVKVLRNKKLNHVMGFRHSAMWGQFNRYGGQWYLEVTPTYVFTAPDGVSPSRLAPEWTSGIKRLEKNQSVLGQLVMWEELLTAKGNLFVEPYPFLGFGRLLEFPTDRGIDDQAWTPDDDPAGAADDLPAGLFDA